MSNFIGQIKNFFERQTENFRVLLATMVLNTSIKTMTTSRARGASYLQLYLRSLGANPQQLGYLNSLTHIANTLFAIPIGWFSDRFSLKKVALAGFYLIRHCPNSLRTIDNLGSSNACYDDKWNNCSGYDHKRILHHFSSRTFRSGNRNEYEKYTHFSRRTPNSKLICYNSVKFWWDKCRGDSTSLHHFHICQSSYLNLYHFEIE
jgi:hypothetical protein